MGHNYTVCDDAETKTCTEAEKKSTGKERRWSLEEEEEDIDQKGARTMWSSGGTDVQCVYGGKAR